MKLRFLLLLSVQALILVQGVRAAAPTAGDWVTGGGDNGHSGLSTEVGPATATVLWDVPSFGMPGNALLAVGSRVLRVGLVQTTSFSHVVIECHDLGTGALNWSVALPFDGTSQGAGRCLGADHGRLYASRGARIRGFDIATGVETWISADSFAIDYWEDAVFTPEGDLIVDTESSIHRVRASDGTTAWTTVRPGSGVGGQGVALRGNSIYAHQSSGAGAEILELDVATGAIVASSGPLGGAFTRSAPFLGPGGMVYAAYTSAQPGSIVALRDEGAGFSTRWTTPTAAAGSVNLRYAVGPDGSVYHVAAGFVVRRLDAQSGAVLAQSAPIPVQGSYGDFRLTVDALGRVYVSNGGFASFGRLFAFDRELATLWSTVVSDVAYGGPILAQDGTLLVARGSGIVAYRVPRTPTQVYCAGDGSASACPCNAGFPGNGCPNSAQPGGARLESEGVASVAADSFRLRALAMPDTTCLYAQGTGRRNGGLGAAFGDGLACLDGTIVRLGIRAASGGTSLYPGAGGVPISIQGQVPASAGVTRTYQVWYRNPAAFCTPAAFNLTNGLEAPWSP
ncbi:MAG: hypothetical protein NTY35_13775 [Planctomycetota bacterium]|nr:hypothetical protein [Planctomycetota bacterium]